MEIRFGELLIRMWPIALMLSIALMVSVWRRTRQPAYVLCFALFTLYLLFAIHAAFFPMEFINLVGYSPYVLNVNLIPLKFDFSEIPPEYFLREILQNVLLTIPFGFGIHFVARLRTRDALLIIPAVAFGIEAIQFLFAFMLGYLYRSIDINDVIFAALGMLIGYAMFRLFSGIYVSAVKRFNLNPTGLAAYFYNVAAYTGANAQQSVSVQNA